MSKRERQVSGYTYLHKTFARYLYLAAAKTAADDLDHR